MTVHPFAQRPLPTLAGVGGKGLSLIRMSHAGLAVPPGFVLGVGFFASWFEALELGPAWADFLAADEATMPAACVALKAHAEAFVFSASQREAVAAALEAFAPDTLFAVRSSSPEEDLDGSSFAGGYETVLGVTTAALESAVRRAFASCLDARVAIYKREHGFDIRRPRIGVVVQKQVASDVAGVGFSVDPIDNDHDVAAFNANWGLGETVVSGTASPDLFRVNKVSRTIVSRERGAKETSVWLTPSGGTIERPDPRTATLSLTDDEVLRLTAELVTIEELYGKPMDIEWAFERGALYLLQARPITTHLALPPALMTAPGAPRRLYADVTVSVQGLMKPMSMMASSVLGEVLGTAATSILGSNPTADLDHTLVYAGFGRLYAVLSNALAFTSVEKIASAASNIDPVAADALRTIDAAAYTRTTADTRVPWQLVFQLPSKALELLDARLSPAHSREECERHYQAYLGEMADLDTRTEGLLDFVRAVGERAGQRVFMHFVPAFATAKVAMAHIREMFADAPEEIRAELDLLDRSLPGNVTVEMGLALARLGTLVPPGSTVEDLERALVEKHSHHAFAEAWEDFLWTYGHRGAGELDVAVPRYRESPRVLLQQVAQAAGASEEHDAAAIYRRSLDARERAATALSNHARARSWLQHKRFESLYACVVHLGGMRETPKFMIIKGLDRVRARLLDAGSALVAAHRLDRRNDVFGLTLTDLDRAERDTGYDLRAALAAHAEAMAGLVRARELPRLIDSRGRILRPPTAPLRDGEIAGHPVSVGVVRGRVKVLHTPDEKPLLPGEILVARATDPGWTPLFVNAAAVVLEVGGVMQHGALVAREYGKPCVVGVLDATTRLRDGQEVEVDGTAGVVRML